MRYQKIQKKAETLDRLIDYYRNAHPKKKLPSKKVLDILVPLLFPGAQHLGKGVFKHAYKVLSKARDLALKIGDSKNGIATDMRVYNRLSKNIRNRYFAKIYWHTKYCILQKYGKKKKVPAQIVDKLRVIAKMYQLKDVGKRNTKNIRWVDRHFKIIDASLRKNA